jgi:spore coat polysaccharide biosynthesis predicted glycosyltransferase SpsG
VLNQNLSATEGMYAHRADHTQLLLGPRYALLRPEFLARGQARPAPAARANRVLVTLGGADPVNATARVAAALALSPDPALDARILIGPSNPRADELQAAYADSRLRFLRGSDDMPALMAWAELAVAAAGSTTYELCYLGVPSLLMVLADNQREVCEAAARHGAALSLGWHDALTVPELAARIEALRVDGSARQALSRTAQSVVDGHGAERILAAMQAAGSPRA